MFPLCPESAGQLAFTPGMKRWPELATTDPTVIAEWWSERPDRPVGIATGERAGVWVLDIDVKNDKNGLETLEWLEGFNTVLPATFTVRTSSGGQHRYWRYPGKRVKNNVGTLGLGLDVRGDGGFVVAPYTSKRGATYAIIDSTAPVDAPKWLLDSVTLRRGKSRSPVPGVADDGGRWEIGNLEDLVPNAVDVPPGEQDAYLRDAVLRLRLADASRERMIDVGTEIIQHFQQDPNRPWLVEHVIGKVDRTRENVGPIHRLSDAERRFAENVQAQARALFTRKGNR